MSTSEVDVGRQPPSYGELGVPERPFFPLLEDSLTFAEAAQPKSVTILPTYRCTAACAECCFESHPGIKHRMDRDDLLALIDRVHDELPGVKYVVLSGGEVTLLREDLL